MEYLTRKEIAQKIREDLKKAGYNLRDFSIRARACGYSDSIDITIKNLEIKDFEIEKIAKVYQYYDTDERTGEILQGGNTYVFVKYDYDTWEAYEGKFTQKFITEYEQKKEEMAKAGTPNNCITLFNEKFISATYTVTGNDDIIFLKIGDETKHLRVNNGYGLAYVWARYSLGHYDTITETTKENLINNIITDEEHKTWFIKQYGQKEEYNKEFYKRTGRNYYDYAYYKNWAVKLA